MKVVACYIRVSTAKNQAEQRREINRWLKGNRFNQKTVRWYVDTRTGSNLRRPKFKGLQADILDGKVRAVITWRLDRLFGTTRDGLKALIDWCTKSLRVVSVSQHIDIKGKDCKTIASVLRGIAEMDQETRRERTKAGLEAARARGVQLGRRPGIDKAKVARAKKMAAEGKTLSQIAAALKVSPSTAGRYTHL